MARSGFPPDQVVFHFEVTQKHKEFQKTMDLMEESAALLASVVEKAGLPVKELKLVDQSIKLNYEYDKNDHKYFDGFEGHYEFRLFTEKDEKIITTILNNFGVITGKIEIGIGFTVKDYEKFEDQALEMAVSRAKTKAELLARSTGARLGDILEIAYGDPQPDLESKMIRLDHKSSEMICFDFIAHTNVEELHISDDVTIAWEILD